jgi:hypothetical protein
MPSKSVPTCSSRYMLEYLRCGRGVGRFCSVPAICFDRRHPILSAGQRAGYGSSMALVAAGVTTLEPKPQTLFGDWSDVLRPVEGVVFDQRIASQCLVAITKFSWAMYSCTHSDAKASILLRDTKSTDQFGVLRYFGPSEVSPSAQSTQWRPRSRLH